MFGLKLKQIWVFFTYLKLWVAVAMHNFKWLEKYCFNLALRELERREIRPSKSAVIGDIGRCGSGVVEISAQTQIAY